MNIEINKAQIKKYNTLALVLSIVIPIAVAVLFRDQYIHNVDFSFLPPIYAGINGLTAVLLIAALVAIKNKNRILHERLIKTCLALSATFLVMYVLYHISSESTKFGGTGIAKTVYLTILFSHILLSVVIIPFVLYTYIRGITGRFEMHKKLARITFPLWLYVAITGVIVYFMISPYY